MILLINLLLGLNTYALADRVGNGGDFVLCNENKYLTFFYDYYEMKRINKIAPIVPNRTVGDPFKIASEIIDRQSEKNKLFKEQMLKYLQSMQDHFINDDTPLVFLKDNPGYKLEKNCRIAQAAISGEEKGVWVYQIYGPAWDFLDNANRVALLLHEIIYRLAWEHGQTDSHATKLLNQALMMSGAWTDPNEIYNLRKQLNLLVDGEF